MQVEPFVRVSKSKSEKQYARQLGNLHEQFDEEGGCVPLERPHYPVPKSWCEDDWIFFLVFFFLFFFSFLVLLLCVYFLCSLVCKSRLSSGTRQKEIRSSIELTFAQTRAYK